MEVRLAITNVLIMLTLFCSSIRGRDVTTAYDVPEINAESSPKRTFVRKSMRYPSYDQVTLRVDERVQPWKNQLQMDDPSIDSLLRSNSHLINTIQRLEVKFDRILDRSECEQITIQDVMKELNGIHQHMRGSDKNFVQMDHSPKMNEMPQNNFMKELVVAVEHSNENVKKLVTNFDTVMDTAKRSMQSLQKIVEVVQDINDRTLQIHRVSSHQIGGKSKSDTSSGRNSVPVSSRSNIESKGNTIIEHNNNVLSNDEHTRADVNYDWIQKAVFDESKSTPSTGFNHEPTHKTSGSGVNNWNRNDESTNNVNSNRNSIVTSTNELEGKDRNAAQNLVKNVDGTKEFQDFGIFDRNFKPSQGPNNEPNVNLAHNFNSHLQTTSNAETILEKEKDSTIFTPATTDNKNAADIIPRTHILNTAKSDNTNSAHHITTSVSQSFDSTTIGNKNVAHNRGNQITTSGLQSFNAGTTVNGNNAHNLGSSSLSSVTQNVAPATTDNKNSVFNQAGTINTFSGSSAFNTATNINNNAAQNGQSPITKSGTQSLNATNANITNTTHSWVNSVATSVPQTKDETGENLIDIRTSLPTSSEESKENQIGFDRRKQVNLNNGIPSVTSTSMNHVTNKNDVLKSHTTLNDNLEETKLDDINGRGYTQMSGGIFDGNEASLNYKSNGNTILNWNSDPSTTSYKENAMNGSHHNHVVNNNESNVNGIIDHKENANYGSDGDISLNRQSFTTGHEATKVQLEKVTIFNSKEGTNIDGNISPTIKSSNSNFGSIKSENFSGMQQTQAAAAKVTLDPTINNSPTTNSNQLKGSYYGDQTYKITTTTPIAGITTTTPSPKVTLTTTTTIKPPTNIITQRKYRNVRKNMQGITMEPKKRDCNELTVKRNGIYKFGSLDELANDDNRFFFERYCDFHTDNRAWTVIRRRFANYGELDFNRTWLDYKLGFGELDDEFWFGNEFIYQLTSNTIVELRIVSEDENGNTNWSEYSLFKVKSERENYKLVIGNYKGGNVDQNLLYQNGAEFSTYDRNNNALSCASTIGNGWWFKDCTGDNPGNLIGRTSTLMMVRPKK